VGCFSEAPGLFEPDGLPRNQRRVNLRLIFLSDATLTMAVRDDAAGQSALLARHAAPGLGHLEEIRSFAVKVDGPVLGSIARQQRPRGQTQDNEGQAMQPWRHPVIPLPKVTHLAGSGPPRRGLAGR